MTSKANWPMRNSHKKPLAEPKSDGNLNLNLIWGRHFVDFVDLERDSAIDASIMALTAYSVPQNLKQKFLF